MKRSQSARPSPKRDRSDRTPRPSASPGRRAQRQSRMARPSGRPRVHGCCRKFEPSGGASQRPSMVQSPISFSGSGSGRAEVAEGEDPACEEAARGRQGAPVRAEEAFAENPEQAEAVAPAEERQELHRGRDPDAEDRGGQGGEEVEAVVVAQLEQAEREVAGRVDAVLDLRRDGEVTGPEAVVVDVPAVHRGGEARDRPECADPDPARGGRRVCETEGRRRPGPEAQQGDAHRPHEGRPRERVREEAERVDREQPEGEPERWRDPASRGGVEPGPTRDPEAGEPDARQRAEEQDERD